MKEQTLILSSGQCSWAKCFACGWGKLVYPVDMKKMEERVKAVNLDGVEKLKVFASGSFFDNKQFTKEFRKWFSDYLKKSKIKEVVVESRPEYITQKNIDDFKGIKLTIGIGLECADNSVLKKYNKGYTVEDYLKAVELLHKNKSNVRTYIMVNIPFGSVELLDKSVELAKKHMTDDDSMVLINTFPHSKANLFDVWIQGKWSPMTTEEFEKIVSKYKNDKRIETDSQNYTFIPKFPTDRKAELKGANSQVLNHRHFEVWQDFFQKFYTIPENKTQVLFLQCAFQKPYSKSNTHKKIDSVLKDYPKFNEKIHRIVLSTPGVIPFEYENYYPFNAYDWPEWEETDEIRQEYRKVVGERIKKFLEKHKYKNYYSYLKPESDTYAALKKACDDLKIKLINLFDEKVYQQIKNEKNPVSRPEAIGALRKKLCELNV